MLHLGETLGDLGPELAHAHGELLIGLLDAVEQGAARGEVVVAIGAEQQPGRVRHVALVDRDQATREHVERVVEPGAGPLELRLRLIYARVQLGLALLALRQHRGELELAGGRRLGLGARRGERIGLRLQVGPEALRLGLGGIDPRLKVADGLRVGCGASHREQATDRDHAGESCQAQAESGALLGGAGGCGRSMGVHFHPSEGLRG